jgi:hypothetical protein
LRLVCSRLNIAVEPTVLSTLVIDVFHSPKRSIHQLEALANHKTNVCKFTRRLKIYHLAPRYDSGWTTRYVKFAMREPSAHDVETSVKQYLVQAVSSLKRIETIM